MRARVYFPSFPFPPTTGAGLVVADQVRHLASAGHEVELVCWWDTRASIEANAAQGDWPSGAMWTLLEGGRESRLGRLFRVSTSLLRRFTSPELAHYPPSLLSQVARLGEADLAIYHYGYAFAWLCQKERLPPERKRVVHMHNVESDVYRSREGTWRWFHQRTARRLAAHEAALGLHVDELWFLSPLDAASVPGATTRIVPPTFPPGLRAQRAPAGAREVVLGFIGAMDFQPNDASARWILTELAPRLAGAGFAGKLVFVGRGASEALRDLGARFPFVEFRGFVPSLDAFWAELSFLLAPHVVGSGVRTKLMEAVASGVPVLTNGPGAAPLPREVRECAFVICRDDPDEWARVVSCEDGPQATRLRLADEPSCSALTAHAVYGGILG